MLPPPVRDAMSRLLFDLDAELPGVTEGLYVVGSAATGAFVPARSDADFVAVLSRDPSAAELARVRRRCRIRFARAVLRGIAGPVRRWPMGVNGIYVRRSDLTRSPLEITPVAGQISGVFTIGSAHDLNPVIWKLLAEHGFAVRGPDPGALGIVSDPAVLRDWTLANLQGYWTRWARGLTRSPRALLLPHRTSSWGVLGAPRLHYTLATGRIASKEEAGAYALETFDARWHTLIHAALAYRAGDRAPRPSLRETAAFVDMVIRSATA